MIDKPGNPNEPLEPWEIRAFMDTTRDFRKIVESERLEFMSAVKAIPGIKRETERQSVALFSTDEDNEVTGMMGLVPTAREFVITFRLLKKTVPWIWAAVAAIVSLFGTIIGMLYELVKSGALKGILP
jgi:hypothetical protein